MRGCVVKTVLKDGTERYGIKWVTPSGRQCWKTVGTKRQAQKALVDVLGEMHKLGSAYQYSNTRFDAYLSRYLQVCEEARMKPSTIATYRSTSRRLLAFYGNAKVREQVTVQSVQAFISDRLAAGDTPKTVNKTLWLLSGMCESAVNEGVLTLNPVRRVKKPRVLRSTERAILTPQQTAEVLRWVTTEYRPALTVLAMLALRPSELCGLVYDTDISFKSSELIIQRVCWRGSLHLFPKQNKIRRVAFGSTVRTILEGQRVGASNSRHGTIFSGRGGGLLDAKVLNIEFKAACKRAGIALPEGADGLYTLRHSALSSWLEAGIDPATVASIAGHSVRTLLAVYTHPHKANAQKAAKVMEEAMMSAHRREDGSEVAQSA
jgi:site-specific recombinase XerD